MEADDESYERRLEGYGKGTEHEPGRHVSQDIISLLRKAGSKHFLYFQNSLVASTSAGVLRATDAGWKRDISFGMDGQIMADALSMPWGT